MITSIVGRLIKKPEVAERIQIPGKHVVNFTVVENRNRGERRLSVFFNLSLIIGTDAQFDLAMRLDKGTVLLFSAPRITYVRQSDKSDTEQTINLYADADNFKIVAGAGIAEGNPASDGGDVFAAAPRAVVPAAAPAGRGVASSSSSAVRGAIDRPDRSDPEDLDDPFAEYEPTPVRSGSPRSSSSGGGARPAAPPQPAPVPSAGRPGAGRSAQSAAPPPPQSPGASRAVRGRAVPPPAEEADEEDMADLPDPFAESDL